LAAIGEALALTAAGSELSLGTRSRPHTVRARDITWTEKKPESSMFAEGCAMKARYSALSSPISAILLLSMVSNSAASSPKSMAE